MTAGTYIKQWMLLTVCLLSFSTVSAEVRTIVINPAEGDMVPALAAALKQAGGSAVKLVFSPGRYYFYPDHAKGEYCRITNHGNGYKQIAIPLTGMQDVEMEGNGAEFIFHGQIIPFLIESCSRVTVRDLSIDWDIPFVLQAAVTAVNEKEGWYDAVLETDGFSWEIRDSRLYFPNIDGFSFNIPGCSIAFDPEKRQPAYGSSLYDFQSRPYRTDKQPDGTVRFYDRPRAFPPVGSVVVSKGGKGEERYGPAFHVKSSQDVVFENVTVHYAPGMGFLCERTENVRLSGCSVFVKEGSSRLVSTAADATHFCNCRGEVLLENCRFESMLDDATNVHGTYVTVDAVLDEYTLRTRLMHFEQTGFEFAAPGDEIWMIIRPLMDHAAENTVVGVNVLNDVFTELTFKEKLPAGLSAGDVLENKTWNPDFTMRGCTVRKNRARGILLKTPGKIFIEENTFSTMMSAVLFRGDPTLWYESGAVNDALIRRNRFIDCIYGGGDHAVLMVSPRLGREFSATKLYDRGIRFEDNMIETFDNRIVVAEHADRLTVSGNQIIQTKTATPFHPDAYLIDLKHCENAVIKNNRYQGEHTRTIFTDEPSKTGLAVSGNEGF